MGGINSEADGAVSGLPGTGKASACSANPLMLKRTLTGRTSASTTRQLPVSAID